VTETADPSFPLPTETRRHIGRRIAAARVFRGLTPAAIETALGHKPGFVALMEDGEGPLCAAELHRMMMHLGIGVRFFYDAAPPRVASLIAKTSALGHASGSQDEILALLERLSEANDANRKLTG
jgi:hypothetical protein